jgi:hypothetical protein
LTAALAGLAAIAVVAPGLAAGGRDAVKVGTELKGKHTEPGPGDPDGGGKIALFLKANKKRVCWDLSIRALDPVVSARIHKAGAAEQGPEKLRLFRNRGGLAGTGDYKGCVKRVRKPLVRALGNNASAYYVNIYTDSYPEGAARGQLKPRGRR